MMHAADSASLTTRMQAGGLPLLEVDGWSSSRVAAIQSFRGLAGRAPSLTAGFRVDSVDGLTLGALDGRVERVVENTAPITSGVARENDVSPLAAFNLALHVGDDPVEVQQRRDALLAAAGVKRIKWLNQIHGSQVDIADDTNESDSEGVLPQADAVITASPGVGCVVMTADCLPILIAARDGSVVGAVHAGWRGVVAGVIEASVAAVRALRCVQSGIVDQSPSLQSMARDQGLEAWIGPGIGHEAFEIGPEVREALLRADRVASVGRFSRRGGDRDEHIGRDRDGSAASDAAFDSSLIGDARRAFQQGRNDRWLADLTLLARRRLAFLGVQTVACGACTFSDAQHWYSHRRDPGSGRQVSMIWRR